VASLAFGASVGVLDGNVIRILCRRFGLSLRWWQSSGRHALQSLADQMVEGKNSAVLNQAMMDLGSTVCLPKSPKCVLCPWIENCLALKLGTVESLPLKKAKREPENWVWYPQLHRKRGRLALVNNTYAPFLRGQWFLPGKVRRQSQIPKTFDYRHSITHHRIFVKIQDPSINLKELHSDTTIKWVRESELARWTPSSLIHKAVHISPP
jgi:A/G-specific adenine glycosylase